LILLLPVQLGYHFWPKFSYVYGLRIDYLSPTVYLTDILVFLILFFWFLEKRKKILIFNSCFLVLIMFLVANCLLAQNRGAAFLKLFKILEFALLALYVAKQRTTLSPITYHLSLAVLWSSLIAIAQFIKQASLGGIFWWLGERTFNLNTPGIARATWEGKFFLRPYSTFSHPNSLAGFILVSLILILGRKNFKMADLLATGLGIFVLILCFSKMVWVTTVFVFLVNFLLRKKTSKQQPAYRQGRLTINNFFLFILLTFLWFGRNISAESLIRRQELANIALHLTKVAPFFGVGLNNFIPAMSKIQVSFDWIWWLQPVHNIFLLVLAETGIIGFLIFLFLIIKTFKNSLDIRNWSLVISLLAILLTGAADHYWLTLQQNQLMFAIIFGLSWQK